MNRPGHPIDKGAPLFNKTAVSLVKSHTPVFQKDREFLQRLEELIDRQYNDCSLRFAKLAAQMEISQRQLQRKLKLLTGSTPSQHLRNYRLQKALPYLKQGDSISETAKNVGFSSQSYFASCFRARFGQTPSEFREWECGENSTNGKIAP